MGSKHERYLIIIGLTNKERLFSLMISKRLLYIVAESPAFTGKVCFFESLTSLKQQCSTCSRRKRQATDYLGKVNLVPTEKRRIVFSQRR